MYEFVDVHGERVTVRSVRTLSGLLQRGTIVAATPFRRAEGAGFEPAAKHQELQAIAAQLGVMLDDPGRVVAPMPSPAVPGPTSSSAIPTPSSQPISTEATPRGPQTRVAAPGPAASQVRPVSRGLRYPIPAGTMIAPRSSPWIRRTLPAPRTRLPADTLAASAGAVLLNLASAAVLGVVLRFVVADATGSRPLATGCMVLATLLAGRYAGRIVAGRVPQPTERSVFLATAMFGLGCYGVAGFAGLVVAAAAATPLWRCLRQSWR